MNNAFVPVHYGMLVFFLFFSFTELASRRVASRVLDIMSSCSAFST